MFQLDINSDAAVIFTNKLEKMHRSALPVAIRTTLNSLAFHLKQKSLLSHTKQEFTNRNKTFFKATSRVEKAKGFDIRTMKSTVGFIGAKKNQAVEDLEMQEKGGQIGGRSFIPMNTAREGGTNTGKVLTKYRFGKIKRLQRARDQKGENRGQKIIKAAFAVGRGGHIISQNGIVFRVIGLKKRGSRIKLKALYTFKKGRKPKVKATNFMKESSLQSMRNIDRFFKVEALKQIKRLT